MLGLSCFTTSSNSFSGEYSKESSVVNGPLAIIIRNSVKNLEYIQIHFSQLVYLHSLNIFAISANSLNSLVRLPN